MSSTLRIDTPWERLTTQEKFLLGDIGRFCLEKFGEVSICNLKDKGNVFRAVKSNNNGIEAEWYYQCGFNGWILLNRASRRFTQEAEFINHLEVLLRYV